MKKNKKKGENIFTNIFMVNRKTVSTPQKTLHVDVSKSVYMDVNMIAFGKYLIKIEQLLQREPNIVYYIAFFISQ